MSKIIFLNGPSSAGKSTLVRAIQDESPRALWHVSSDQFVEAQLLPRRMPETGPNSWPVLRSRFFQAFHRAIPALASPGNELIVEHVIEFDSWMEELVHLLSQHDVFFVGVRCSPEVLAKRERARGDRRIGEGASHVRDGVHERAPYDYEVDTTKGNFNELARGVLDEWNSTGRSNCFRDLAQSQATPR